MQSSSRLFAFLAYIPLAGWLITWLLRRSDSFAMFHLRQAIMLVLTVVAVVLGWAVLVTGLALSVAGFFPGNPHLPEIFTGPAIGSYIVWVFAVAWSKPRR